MYICSKNQHIIVRIADLDYIHIVTIKDEHQTCVQNLYSTIVMKALLTTFNSFQLRLIKRLTFIDSTKVITSIFVV